MAGVVRSTVNILLIAAAVVWAALSSPPPLAAAAATPAPPLPPALSFTAQSVVATGLTPGGRIVWLGVLRELNQGALDWSHVEKIASDVTTAGKAELDLGKPIPLQSIWFAVDLASGQLAAGAPPGYPLRRFDLSPAALPALQSRFSLDRRLVIVLYVRPGVGAWTLRAGDGGQGDADGVVDGAVRVDLAQLAPLDGTPATLQTIASIARGDVLIVVDQEHMDFATVTLN